MEFARSVFFFVVAVGILVVVHEFGHFWVARRLGVKVLRFSVGFGPALWTRLAGKDRTEYVVGAVPLGGYVKMLDEREGPVAPEELDRAFNRKPLLARTAIVLAGPGFNFLFAIVAYAVMFMVGTTGLRALVGAVEPGSLAERAGLAPGMAIVAVNGEPALTWDSVVQRTISLALEGEPARLGWVRMEPGDPARDPGEGATPGEGAPPVPEGEVVLELPPGTIDQVAEGRFFEALGLRPAQPRPIIGEVLPGGAAERAGLRPGDEIIAVNGEPVVSWLEWVEVVRANPGRTLQVVVRRGDRTLELPVTPEPVEGEEETFGRIGATLAEGEQGLQRYWVTERLPPLQALGAGARRTVDVSVLTVKVFWRMILQEVSVRNLSGPISIARYASRSAEIGLAQFLGFLAIVSVSLGIINLLPVPVLDGGHLLFYAVEAVKGSPVSERAQIIGQQIGIALLVGLMGLAFYNDLARLFG